MNRILILLEQKCSRKIKKRGIFDSVEYGVWNTKSSTSYFSVQKEGNMEYIENLWLASVSEQIS